MRARVPASSANLGPGFDVLALALDLYLEVSVEPASRLEVVTTGQGSELPADETHPAVRIAADTNSPPGSERAPTSRTLPPANSSS